MEEEPLFKTKMGKEDINEKPFRLWLKISAS
jgi:hypothetical protein